MNRPRSRNFSDWNTHIVHALCLAAVVVTIRGMAAEPRSPAVPPAFVTEKGPHHRTWSRAVLETHGDGRTVLRTNVAYIELANGMHYWDAERGEWLESRAVIELIDGAAVARYGPHKVRFSADFAAPTLIDLTSPDGHRLRSRIAGLAYTSRSSGRSVLIAEPRPRDGEVLGNDRVLYRDCFDGGFRASALYRWSPVGFEQDLILSERLPSPAEYQLADDPADIVLEVWTEFFDPVEPRRIPAILESEPDPIRRAEMVEPDLIDETLDFGAMMVPLGAAFMSEGDVGGEETDRLKVAKNWVTSPEGRHFLIERISYLAVKARLDGLPPRGAAVAPKKHEGTLMVSTPPGDSIIRPFPALRTAESSAPIGARMAMASRPESGLRIDYNLIGPLTNFTFKADITHWLSNNTTVNFWGTTRLEGGSVIKASQGASSRLMINGGLECLTSDYRPCFFVAKDDDTVGSVISGSTGSPSTNYYLSRALELNSTAATYELRHLRFSNVDKPIVLTAGGLSVAHTVAGRCRMFFYSVSTPSSNWIVHFQNILGYDLAYGINATKGTNVIENATFHRVATLLNTGATNFFTNSLFVSATNSANMGFYGGYNYTNLVDTGIFTNVGAASHYLASDAYRNGGTAGIDPALLAALRLRTTYPPNVIANSNLTASSLSNLVGRDNDGSTDQGFHYSPLDVVLLNTSISNVTVTPPSGFALGIRGGVGTHGVRIENFGSLDLRGNPTNLARVVRYNMVQEEAATNWAASAMGTSIAVTNHTGVAPGAATFRFVEWSIPAGDGYHLHGNYDGAATKSTASLQDCQLVGGRIYSEGALPTFRNDLFDRVQMSIYSATSDYRNCTFNGGNWSVDGTYGTHNALDSLFYETVVDTNYFGVVNHHNGYLTNQARLSPNASNDVIVTGLGFETGPLGRFYLPLGCPLINTSSVPDASTVGMYHMTTTTNQWKETNSVLDIGFHFVATGTNGLASDLDDDGLPDYVEDADGDGVVDGTETTWLHSDSDYDGCSDLDELWDGTDPINPASVNRVRLGYWRFNSASLVGEQGQLPTLASSTPTNGSWSGTSVSVASISPVSRLRYREIEPGGRPNINCRNGTIRFWFRPNWTSANLGGTGPQNDARLVELGGYSADGMLGWWTLALNPSGTNLGFTTHSNGVMYSYWSAPIGWTAGQWYQIALSYSPTNTALFINGTLTTNLAAHSETDRPYVAVNHEYLNTAASGIYSYPSASLRAVGIRIGNDYGDVQQAKGDFDELETFNYPLTAQEIARDFPNFNGATGVTNDLDYDGRSDLFESQVDGTLTNDASSVLGGRLAYWRFNGSITNLFGEALQAPLSTNGIQVASSWSSNALVVTSSTNSAILYRDQETNGWANFNCKSGAVRFWFRPAYGSSGPGRDAPFLFIGSAANATNGQWELGVATNGQSVRFVTASNSTPSTRMTASVNLTSNRWYQIAFNYSPTALALYVDGIAVTNVATGVDKFPASSYRAEGLAIGNNTARARSLNGQFEELETFNRQLTSTEIERSFAIVKATDLDLNGVADLLEDVVLPASTPFAGVPFVVTGAIEAEQFDLGGRGVAYTNVALNFWTNDYRPSQIEVTNCSDLGGGYCVNNLRAGDWLNYTLDVRVGQTYAVDARVAPPGTNVGGSFRLEFWTNGLKAVETGPMVIASTNWSDATYRLIQLPAGTNILRLVGLTNAFGTNVVGRFNYVSIYPAWNEWAPAVGAATNWVSGLTSTNSTTNIWLEATGNAAAIQTAIDTLPAAGGVVRIPSGSYYVAQKVVDENSFSKFNSAIYFSKDNVAIEGAGKSNTVLIAHNRATTVLNVGYADLEPVQPVQRINVHVSNLTIEGRPHWVAVTNTAGPELFTNRWEQGAFSPHDAGGIPGAMGCLVVAEGLSASARAHTLTFTNILLRNPARYPIFLQGLVSNLLVRSSQFIFSDGTNGAFPFPRSTTVASLTTSNAPTGGVGVDGTGTPNMNLVVLDNVFNGNPGLTAVNTNTEVDVADGIVWFQGGGNWYVAHNAITNFGLEGVQFSSGPAASVGNTFHTLVNGYSTAAHVMAWTGWRGPSDVNTRNPDFTYSAVNNWIYGGRHGNLGDNGFNTNNVTPQKIHFTGNRVELYPTMNNVIAHDYPGAVLTERWAELLNVSGNTLVAGGHGVRWLDNATNAIVLKNDFGAASYRSLSATGTNAMLLSATVVRNVLNQGVSSHARTTGSELSGWFLLRNQYRLNGTNTVNPFLEPMSNPVHFNP